LWPKWKNPVSTMTRSRKSPRKTGSRFWNALGANKLLVSISEIKTG